MTQPEAPPEAAPEGESLAAAQRRFVDAQRAMRNGAIYELEHKLNPGDGAVKLRNGLDSASVSIQGLASVLVSKGIATAEEIAIATADAADAEVDAYEDRIREHYGSAVSIR